MVQEGEWEHHECHSHIPYAGRLRHSQQQQQLSVRPACAPSAFPPSATEWVRGQQPPALLTCVVATGSPKRPVSIIDLPGSRWRRLVSSGLDLQCLLLVLGGSPLEIQLPLRKRKKGARSEETGCHLLFRSTYAQPNCTSVCICGENPREEKSFSDAAPRVHRAEPNFTVLSGDFGETDSD